MHKKILISFLLIFLPIIANANNVKKPIILTTEDMPPYSTRVCGKENGNPTDPLTGISIDIVNELFTRANIEHQILIYPWQRSFNTAKNNRNHAVFSATRNQQREHLFKWVGQIASNDWVVFSKKTTSVDIQSIDDMRNYTIGGYQGDALSLYLEKRGIKVDKAPADKLNLQKLKYGRIDLWIAGNLVGAYRADKAGINVKQVFTFKESDLWIAFNINTDDDIIKKLNNILNKMKEDGSIIKLGMNNSETNTTPCK